MTNLTIKNANYGANNIGFSLPIDGAVYANLFEKGQPIIRNLANVAVPATAYGSPSLVDHGLSCKGSAHIVTPHILDITKPFTTIAAYAALSTSNYAPIVSCYSTDDKIGVTTISLPGANGSLPSSAVACVTVNEASVPQNLARGPEVGTVGNLAIAALSYDPSLEVKNRLKFYVPNHLFKTSGFVETEIATEINDFTGMALRVGGHRPGSALSNPIIIRGVATYDRVLTDSEILTMGSYFSGYYGRRGVVE